MSEAKGSPLEDALLPSPDPLASALDHETCVKLLAAELDRNIRGKEMVNEFELAETLLRLRGPDGHSKVLWTRAEVYETFRRQQQIMHSISQPGERRL